MKNNSKKFFFSLIIIFTSFIIRTKSNSYSDTLEIVAQFNITKVKTDKGVEECPHCMPAGIKLSKNGTIFCSFPRWFDNVKTTLAIYNKEEEYFEPWPSLEVNKNYLKSVLGFEIDKQDNIYILDQGKVEGHAEKGSIKLVKYSLSNSSRLHEYIFSDEIADRDIDIIIKRVGLDGKGTRTLEQLGQEKRITRERVRQIILKRVRELSKSPLIIGNDEVEDKTIREFKKIRSKRHSDVK